LTPASVVPAQNFFGTLTLYVGDTNTVGFAAFRVIAIAIQGIRQFRRSTGIRTTYATDRIALRRCAA
jgi:hypothetical protein